MKEASREEEFGCDLCWPADADAASASLKALTYDARLIDESHFIVTIRSCPTCFQRFVCIFMETIDWVDGDDPQYRIRLPLIPSEAVELIQQGASLSEATLNALGTGRKCLLDDYPKGEHPHAYWGTGIRIRYHD